MYYSVIGAIALVILLIENQDIMLNRNKAFLVGSWRIYRRFLFFVTAFYLADILWGILESRKQWLLLFIDTTVYFLIMASGVFLWTYYVISYLEENKTFGRFFILAGRVFASAVLILTVVNIFHPVLFTVDRDCVYQALPARYAILISQVFILLLLSIYSFFIVIVHGKSNEKKNRYNTVAHFGIIMSAFIVAQLFFPYLPLYCISLMLGTCLLRAYVIADEKEEYRRSLDLTKKIANRDALTGVKNKYSYLDEEDRLNALIKAGQAPEFAIVSLDLNDLKKVNDTQGHQAGDEYIRRCCRVICDIFKKSPVYRVGGDEFAVVVTGDDLASIDELMVRLNDQNSNALKNGGEVVACGMSRYEGDERVADVYARADLNMYRNKKKLKGSVR